MKSRSVKLHNLNKVPTGLDYDYNDLDLSELGEEEIECLQEKDVEEAWYWYVSGEYEGTGKMLMRRGIQYGIHNLRHCSCYRAVAGDLDFSPKLIKEFLAEIGNSHDDYKKEILPLLRACKPVWKAIQADNNGKGWEIPACVEER